MLGPIINLTVIALLSGPTLAWLLFPFPLVAILPFSLKILTRIVIILSVLLRLALTSSRVNLDFSRKLTQISFFVGNIGFLPYITGQIVPNSTLKLGSQVLKLRDQG